MGGALDWMAKNHVASNLLMFGILVLGILAALRVSVEVFPEVSMDTVQITVPYPGASPDEVEESIVVKIEEAIKSLDGIERVTSIANENTGIVTAELLLGEDVTEMKDRIKSEIDRITTFPDNAEEPEVVESQRRTDVITVAVYGDTDEMTIKRLAERVRDEILNIEGISQVDLTGVRNYEISIEISEEKLRSYGITFSQITQAVRAGSLDLPAGKVTTRGGEVLLRTKSLGYNRTDYENIIVSSTPDGQMIRIKDIATVIDGFEDSDIQTAFNGKQGAMIKIYRIGDESALDIADKVKGYVDSKIETLPDGIEMSTWLDRSRVLKDRIETLVNNATQGLFLVVLFLALFLEFRLAMLVSVGIAISFIGAFFFMDQTDVSINMISLFGFILVIGIVVDDAIVVGENIFTFREAGYSPQEAASLGVKQVALPVFFSVSTTIAAFVPLLMVDGFMGKFMYVIPVIVIAVLILSLIESFFVLPAHLSSVSITSKSKFINYMHGVNDKIHNRLDSFVRTTYTKWLESAIKNRYLTAASSIAIMLVAVGLIAGGIVRFVFFPVIEADNMIATLSMPKGTTAEQTAAVVRQLEAAALRVQKKFDEIDPSEKSVFTNIYSMVGDQPMSRQSGPGGGGAQIIQSNIAEITVELIPGEEREVTATDMVNEWRKEVGQIPGIKTLTFKSDLLSAGQDVQLDLSANRFTDLMAAIDSIQTRLGQINGVQEIRNDFEAGKSEIKFKLKPEAASLGLTLGSLAQQVRQGFYGDEALRIQRGKDEVKVMVRYPQQDRRSLEDIENMRIRTPLGGEVPFYNVAEVSVGRGYSQIKRANNKRKVALLADVDESIVTPNTVNAKLTNEIIPAMQKIYPSLTISYEGSQREQQKATSSMASGFMVAMFVIFALLAIPFRSYLQPLVVMSVIPFGFVGAVVGHLIFGLDVSIMSMFGLVALAGIVVNNSLVLVDFINTHRYDKGDSLFDAVVNACQKRFRPIVLTSATTFLGLFPIMLETSLQAQFLVPMAVALGFGVLSATAICLILVPANVMIVDDLLTLIRKKPTPAKVQPLAGDQPVREVENA